MTEIEYFGKRVDFLLKNEQETRAFVHQELQRFSLDLLDKMFQRYLKTHCSSNLIFFGAAEFAIGFGMGLAQIPQGDNIRENAENNISLNQKEKEIVKCIWDTSKEQTKKLEFQNLLEFIPILQTKPLKKIVRHLCIDEGTLV